MNYYINRELSWLKFNRRVLEQAVSPTVPIFERLKFLAIFSSNLDEFFMIRVGVMHDRVLTGFSIPDDKTNMTAAEQLAAMYDAARLLYTEHDLYYKNLTAELYERGIRQLDIKKLTPSQAKYVKQYFKREILPLLSPQIIDAKHPFPHFENKRLYVVFALKHKESGKLCYGITPVTNILGRILFLDRNGDPGAISYLLIEDVLLKYSGAIFKQYAVTACSVIKVTRNADVEVEDNFSDETIDYRDYVKIIIKRREKLSPVRMEIYSGSYPKDPKMIKYLEERLALNNTQCFNSEAPLDMSYVYQLESELIKTSPRDGVTYGDNLFYKPLSPRPLKNIAPAESITEVVRKRDVLLSYPYYSMTPYLKLLEEAVNDKDAVSIKITLYRLGANSEVIKRLCEASENGLDVTVIVELKARFDETNNILWSKQLEDAGCKVIYGIDSLKVHSKITLITRKIGGDIEHIAHIASGNYNEKTALLYTDLGIMTSDEKICADAVNFFNNMTLGMPFADDYDLLLVSPSTLKPRVIREIRRQAAECGEGNPAYVCMKMNGLTDKDIITELVFASQAGVKIDLIVRGICCLLPGIKGVSDNIRIVSIVGRFLEHSRIAIFGSDEETRRVYIGSADLMTRNTTRRVEIWTPVLDKTIAAELAVMTKAMLADNVKSSILCSNGDYERALTNAPPFDSQIYFYEQAYMQKP